MTWSPPAAGGLPQQLFASTPAQRVALARQQFFEEGQRPSGLVGEAVIQSWMRCRKAHAPVNGRVVFDAVTPSRLHATLNRNRQLLEVAGQELTSMEASLAGTECRVLLTDAEGVIVHATHNPSAHDPIMRRAARVGVNISEAVVGTTAPGITAKTGQACTVHGAEHYYDFLQVFQCAAAPIRDVHGQLAAVLDLSIESRSFGFDAASMVGLYATSIENRLLQAQAGDHLVLRFQASPNLLGTPLEALAGISGDGQLAWLNGMGARLLGLAPGTAAQAAESVFGVDLEGLLHLARFAQAQTLRLPSGLGVWVQPQLRARDGADFRHAVAMPAATEPAARTAAAPETAPVVAQQAPVEAPAAPDAQVTLGDHSRRLIESTLAACGGNLSRAARVLGVSRGTLYRKLGALPSQDTAHD